MDTIKYTNVKNPKWADEQQTAIICEVNFEHLSEEWVQFVAVGSGDYPHTHSIFQECVSGKYGEIASYEPLPIDIVEAQIRDFRNSLLAKTDWTQLPDVPQSLKDLWATYRQALRNITDQPGFPYDVTWPTPPS